jgi:hypothetical protein
LVHLIDACIDVVFSGTVFTVYKEKITKIVPITNLLKCVHGPKVINREK